MSQLALPLQLNESEYEIVCRQNPDTREDGGYQGLLVTLQNITDETTRIMTLPTHLIPRIRKYAFDYGNGGWEDRLTGIFSRHLGPNLDQIPQA